MATNNGTILRRLPRLEQWRSRTCLLFCLCLFKGALHRYELNTNESSLPKAERNKSSITEIEQLLPEILQFDNLNKINYVHKKATTIRLISDIECIDE